MDGEVKLLTLVIPVDDDKKRVLLGLKKRGFGEGYYNGFGGKVEPGEYTHTHTQLETEREAESHLKVSGSTPAGREESLC